MTWWLLELELRGLTTLCRLSSLWCKWNRNPYALENRLKSHLWTVWLTHLGLTSNAICWYTLALLIIFLVTFSPLLFGSPTAKAVSNFSGGETSDGQLPRSPWNRLQLPPLKAVRYYHSTCQDLGIWNQLLLEFPRMQLLKMLIQHCQKKVLLVVFAHGFP